MLILIADIIVDAAVHFALQLLESCLGSECLRKHY